MKPTYFGILKSTASSSLLSGLVSYWNFNETSGNLLDSVGTHPGTLGEAPPSGATSPTQGASGILGTAYSFDGVNNSITLDSSITTGTTFSLSFWFKPNTQSPSFAEIFGNDNFSVAILYNGATLKIEVLDPTNLYSTTTALTDVQWSHIVWTCNAGTVGMYINGQPDVITCTGFPSFGANRIGNDSEQNPIKAYVDEMGFWNRVLTASDVSTLYNGGVGKTYPFS